jgi:DNA-binding IclR family transcriptional regulator
MDTVAEPPDRGNHEGGGSTAVSTGVGVLDRSVRLLNLLADGPQTLRQLAEASGLPRPTAHRLLLALEAHRLVSRPGPGPGASQRGTVPTEGSGARNAAGAFRLGPRLTELAASAGPAVDLAALAEPVLARLHAASGESVQLYVRSGDSRLCLAARDAGARLRDTVPVGAMLPLTAGSGGKVLLAWSDDADRFPAVPATVLAGIRKRGWAASVAEREPGVTSVSAPVLAGGRLLGAVCVSGPVSRLGQSPGKLLAPLVVSAAAELSQLASGLGGP